MKRALSFRIVLILFIIVAVWWTTYFPYNREMLYRSVPMSSDLIIEQPRIYDYWEKGRSGMLRDLLEASEAIGEGQLEELLTNKRLDWFLKAVASRNTLIARVPSMSEGVQPALVIASWAGARGQLLNWSWGFALRAMAKRETYHYGMDLWSIELDNKNGGYQYFSFAYVEGVLVGCLSHQQFSVDYIVDRMMFSRSLAPALQKRLKQRDSSGDGWLALQNAGILGSQAFTYSFSTDSGFAFSCDLKWQKENPFRADSTLPSYGADCRQAEMLLGDIPAAAVIAPYQFFEWQMIAADSKGKLIVLRKLFRENMQAGTPVFVSLCAPEYSGKMRGFKVPSLVFGMKLRNPEFFSEAIAKGIDELNASYKLNIIATEKTINGHTVYHFDQVTGSFFNEMGDAEKPALYVAGDWVIVGSNADIIRHLIEDSSRSPKISGIDFDQSTFVCWAVVDSLRDVLVNIIAMNDLWAIAVQRSRNTEFRAAASGLKMLLGGLKNIKTCVAATVKDGDDTELHVRFQ